MKASPTFFAVIMLFNAALAAFLAPSAWAIFFALAAIHGSAMTAARIIADQIAQANTAGKDE